MAHPRGVNCKVANVREPIDDLVASRSLRRPAAASDKVIRLALRDVVGTRREQCRIGFGQNRQRADQRIAVIIIGELARIARRQQFANRIEIGRLGDPING